MYCKFCGSNIPDNSAFCPDCGANQTVQQETACQYDSFITSPFDNEPSMGVPAGYSQLLNDPRFQGVVRGEKRTTRGCLRWVMPFPLVFFTAIGMMIETFGEEEGAMGIGMTVGLVFSAIFLIIVLVTSAKKSVERPWEGVVADKKITTATKRETHNGRTEFVTNEYVKIYIKGSDGRQHIIEERCPGVSNQYFEIGDRLRFIPKMGFFYPYEKFDKSRDNIIVCVFCGRITSIYNDTCSHCGKPLLK